MDYGKLAYMKAEDLEAKLTVNSAAPKFRSSAQTVTLSLDLSSGQEIYLTQVTASGAAALVVKLNCSVFKSGTIEVLVGGLKLGVSSFGRENGSECEGIVVGQALIEGSQSMSIKAVDGFVGSVKSVDILSYGNNVSVDMRLSGMSVDGSYGNFMALVPVNNTVYYASGMNETELLAASRLALGRGSKCDVVFLDGLVGMSGAGFRAVYADNFDNVWGVVFGENPTFKRVYLGHFEGLKSVKLAAFNNRLVVAFLIGGKIYYSLCGTDFCGMTTLNQTETHIRVEEFGFLKNDMSLTLYFCGEGKSFVKTLEEESRNSELIKIKVSVKVKEA